MKPHEQVLTDKAEANSVMKIEVPIVLKMSLKA